MSKFLVEFLGTDTLVFLGIGDFIGYSGSKVHYRQCTYSYHFWIESHGVLDHY